MDELTSNVNIANRTYRLKIDKMEEKTVKRAEQLINERVKEYAKSYAFKDEQDLLAMVALQYCTHLLTIESKTTTIDDQLVDKL